MSDKCIPDTAFKAQQICKNISNFIKDWENLREMSVLTLKELIETLPNTSMPSHYSFVLKSEMNEFQNSLQKLTSISQNFIILYHKMVMVLDYIPPISNIIFHTWSFCDIVSATRHILKVYRYELVWKLNVLSNFRQNPQKYSQILLSTWLYEPKIDSWILHQLIDSIYYETGL